jgi:hypothetical protein
MIISHSIHYRKQSAIDRRFLRWRIAAGLDNVQDGRPASMCLNGENTKKYEIHEGKILWNRMAWDAGFDERIEDNGRLYPGSCIEV